MIRLLLLATLVACGGGGDADPVDARPPIDADPAIDAPPPRQTITSTQTLQPNELVEAEMTGGGASTGDRAIIQLMAPTATLDWNIHAHPAGGVVTVHEELDQMMVRYDFIPSEQADWYLLLRNSGGATMDVQVTIELYGSLTFEFL